MPSTDNLVNVDLSKDLKGLVDSTPSRKAYSLKSRPVRAPIPSSIGIVLGETPTIASTSGVASPFTEESREFVIQTVTDQFGLWSFELAVPTIINMKDANGSDAVFNYTA